MKGTDPVTSPESPHREAVEAGGSEALSSEVREASAELPEENNEAEPEDDEAGDKTHSEPQDACVEEDDVKPCEDDQDQGQVMKLSEFVI